MSAGLNPYQTGTARFESGASTPVKAPGPYMALAITMIILGVLGALSNLACQIPNLAMIQFGPQMMQQTASQPGVNSQQAQQYELFAILAEASRPFLGAFLVLLVLSFPLNVFWIIAGAAATRGKTSGRALMLVGLIIGALVAVGTFGVVVLNTMATSEAQQRFMAEKGMVDPFPELGVIIIYLGYAFRGGLVLAYLAAAVYLMTSTKVRDYIASKA